MTEFYHTPVMPEEIMRFVVANPAGIYVDCTAGGGGHSAFLLERNPGIRMIAVDCDEEAIGQAEVRLQPYGGRAVLVRDNFRNIAALVAGAGYQQVDGIFADLGVSSRQLDRQERGFCFASTTLDMRMDNRLEKTAADLVNSLDEQSLADLVYTYGDEFRSRPIARAIVNERQRSRITTAAGLAAVIERVKPRRGKTHPATQVFQALRIAVNKEMENLELFLSAVPQLLVPGGRIAVLSYHSLEDRLVKNSFRDQAAQGLLKVITKKILRPSENEVSINPRSRSAKLRAAEKI